MLIKLGWQGPVRKGEKEKEERRKRRVSRERERERKGRGSIVSSAHACRRRECTARYRPRIRSCTTEYVYMCMYIRVSCVSARSTRKPSHEMRFPSEVWASRLLNQCATVFRIRVHASRSWNVNELSSGDRTRPFLPLSSNPLPRNETTDYRDNEERFVKGVSLYIHTYIYVINRVFRLRSREATSRKAARFRVSGSGTIETGAMQCTRWQCARVEECEPADWSGAVSHPGEKTCREGRVAARLFRRENDVAENDARLVGK